MTFEISEKHDSPEVFAVFVGEIVKTRAASSFVSWQQNPKSLSKKKSVKFIEMVYSKENKEKEMTVREGEWNRKGIEYGDV